jgi:HSP20 family protein
MDDRFAGLNLRKGFESIKEVNMMQLTPWRRPHRRDITRFNREMDTLWDRFFSDMPFAGFEREWMPSVDVAESDGDITVRAELPGLEAKDIDLNISGDLLSIRGEKKSKEEVKEDDYFSRESYYGSFQRSIRLPAEVQSDKVDASFKNGVLDIKLPKFETTQSKKIEIKA